MITPRPNWNVNQPHNLCICKRNEWCLRAWNDQRLRSFSEAYIHIVSLSYTETWPDRITAALQLSALHLLTSTSLFTAAEVLAWRHVHMRSVWAFLHWPQHTCRAWENSLMSRNVPGFYFQNRTSAKCSRSRGNNCGDEEQRDYCVFEKEREEMCLSC